MSLLSSYSEGPSWSWTWSYSNWIYNYLGIQCLSPLKLLVLIPFMARCSWDKLYMIKFLKWHVPGWWFLRVLWL